MSRFLAKAKMNKCTPTLKEQQNEACRSVELDRHNQMLQGNVGQLMMKGGRTDNGKKHTSKKSSNTVKKRYELVKVAHENQELLRKLNAIEPTYDHKKFLLDWKRQHLRRALNRPWPVHHRFPNKTGGLDSYDVHRRKVLAAKAVVNNMPKSNDHVVICKLKKLESAACRSAEIGRHNKELQDRLAKIMRTGGRTDNRNMYTSRESSHAINRRLELIRVAHENQKILKKLSGVGPFYDHKGFVLVWKRKHLRRAFNSIWPIHPSNVVKFPPHSYRAYQPFQPIPHRLLNKNWGLDPYEEHRRKVCEAKAMVNTCTPKVDPHVISKVRKLQNEAYQSAWLDRHNKELQDKMDTIKMKGGRMDCKTNKKSLNAAKRRYELVQIAHENQKILKKLTVVKPSYDREKLLVDWKKHCQLVRNISRFPPPGHPC